MRPAQPDEPASKGRSPDPMARPAVAWRSSSWPSSARWWGGFRPVNTATGRPSGEPDPHGRFGGMGQRSQSILPTLSGGF